MKNIFKTLAIVALGFFATSCVSADVDDAQLVGGEGVVNLTVSTPGATSRAIADGKSATQLTCGVYDADWNYLTKIDGQFDGSSLTTTVSIRLVNKKVYNFVFWAQDPDADCYTLTLEGEPNVAVTYNGVANDESRDAFFGQLTNLQVDGTMNEKVELTRPFAQVNFGTLDTELAKTAGFDITVAEAKTTVTTRAYNTLYLGNNQHGAVGGAQDVQVTFSDAALPNEDLYLLNDTSHTTPYDWLTMNYILVPETESTLSECTLTVKDNKGQSVEVKYPNAPVKRNWRTNLVGNLLTDNVVIEVEILPIPEGDLTNASGYYVQNGVYHIQNATGLAWFAEQVNGGNSFSGVKVVLDGDIVLSATRAASNWTPIGNVVTTAYESKKFAGIFDGNGYSIKNMVVTEQKTAGFFGSMYSGTIRNLTIENATVNSNHYAAGLIAWVEQGGMPVVIENCHVKNSTITTAPELVNGVYDNGDKAGGLVGYAYAGAYKNCSVENVAIKGYCDLGGIAGYATKATVSNCLVKNVTITQDLTNGYKSEVPTTLGAVVGRVGDNNTIENNTVENVNVGTAANNVEELNAALAANDNATVLLPEGEYETQSGLGNGAAGEITIAGNGADNTTIVTPTTPTNNSLPDVYASNKDVVFKDLTFVNTYGGYESGIGAAKSVTFINCRILGEMYCQSHAPHTFINCTFDPYNGYLYTWNSDCVFEGCTFEASEGKALQVYGDGPRTNHVDIKNCKFTAAKVAYTWPGTPEEGKPVTAIDINSANNAKMIVNIEKCEATGFGIGEFSGNNLWNIKSGALSANSATVTVDGETFAIADVTMVTPSNIDSINFTKSGSYKLVGDFSSTAKKEVVITTAEDSDVVIDAEGATLPKHFVVKLNKYADSDNDVKRDNGRKGKYTLKKFNTEVLSVGITGATVTVTECTLEYLDFWGGNAAVAITDNTIDGKGVEHERIDGNLQNYGVYIALMNYDLSIERNNVTNTLSHAIGINGLTTTFKQYASYNAYNTIASFTGNIVSAIGAYKDERVGFKVWDDVTYAPAAATTIDSLPAAGKSLILAIDEDTTNVFTKAAASTYDAYKFDFYNCLYSQL